MLASLRKVKVTPVFTAHPTEITRHTIRLKRRRIAGYLERLDRLPCEEISPVPSVPPVVKIFLNHRTEKAS